MTWEENGEIMGECPTCQDCGPVGQYCETCGDTTAFYERLNENEAEARECYYRRKRPLLDRLIESVSISEESTELGLFFSLLADEFYKTRTIFKDYVIRRVDEMNDMDIRSVNSIMLNLYLVLTATVFDDWGDEGQMEVNEQEAICRIGTMWIQHEYMRKS